MTYAAPLHSDDPLLAMTDPLVVALTDAYRSTPIGTVTLTHTQLATIAVRCASSLMTQRIYNGCPTEWGDFLTWSASWLAGSRGDTSALVAEICAYRDRLWDQLLGWNRMYGASVPPEGTEESEPLWEAQRDHISACAMGRAIAASSWTETDPGTCHAQVAADAVSLAHWVAMFGAGVTLDVAAVCHQVVGS